MAQPSTQVQLASGHSGEYFWYAQGTGIYDAKNNAMLSKTGSAGMSTEGGANVALGNSSTWYSLASALDLTAPYTLRFRARAVSGSDAMAMGNTGDTDSFFWLDNGSGSTNLRVPFAAHNGYFSPAVNNVATSLAIYSFTVDESRNWVIYKNGSSIASGTDGDSRTITFQMNALLAGYGSGALSLNGAFEFAHVIPGSALSAGAVATLDADPYSVLDTGPVTPSLVVSDGSHAHTADNLALTIIGTLSIADSSHSHAADSITLTATSNGTITIPAVRDWGTKALKTGQTGVQVDIRSITTGALVVRKTGQTTHASTGVCVVTDAAIVAGTTYEVVTRFADGSRGMWDYTAS